MADEGKDEIAAEIFALARNDLAAAIALADRLGREKRFSGASMEPW